jgi:FixJ family two-component response regulator
MITTNATVFVVDDDAAMRDSLRDLIRSVGLRFELFDSAQDFLRSERPDVPGCLVLDVRMPGQSGLDLQRRLNEAGVAIPIIFITGHGDVPMGVHAMKAGALEFLTKPFRDQDLLDAIQQALDRDCAAREERAATEAIHRRFASLTSRERESDGKSGWGNAQQADSSRTWYQREHRENSPSSGNGKDGSQFSSRVGPDGS